MPKIFPGKEVTQARSGERVVRNSAKRETTVNFKHRIVLKSKLDVYDLTPAQCLKFDRHTRNRTLKVLFSVG